MASQPKKQTDVTYEDQQQINSFSKMHLRSKDILAEIKAKKVCAQYMQVFSDAAASHPT